MHACMHGCCMHYSTIWYACMQKMDDVKIFNFAFRNIRKVSLAAPDPTTLKKRSGETQYKKVQTGMQSVTYSFRNIIALSIIDIINQLLRATESGRVAWVTYSSPCGSPVAAKLQGGTLLRKKNDWNSRQFVEGLASYHQVPIFVIRVNYTRRARVLSQYHNDGQQHETFKMNIEYVTVFN